jgi:hypothetical protein
VRGPRDAVRHQVQGLLLFGAGLAATTGSRALVHAWGTPSHAVEVVVLTAANLGVTVLRFGALKLWVFVRRPEPDGAPGPISPSAAGPGCPAGTLPGSAAAPRG